MNISFLRRTVLALAVGFLAQAPAWAQTTNQQLYGITFFDNQLIAIDPTTGQGTLVANLSTNVSAYGIATLSNVLYTFNPNMNRIMSVNRTTGLATAFNIGVTNLQGEGDLAFRGDGTGFLSSGLNADGTVANSLYSFNLSSNSYQWIGATTVCMDALAFDTNNILYGLGQDDTNLYIVDQTDASLTVVGSLGVALSSPFGGMTFGPDGTLYAAINDQLYTINKTSGTASVLSTNVLNIGYNSVSGLAFGPSPAPAGFFAGEALLGGGIYYLAFTNSNIFGYYSLANFPYVYHFDLGYEYFIDANDGKSGAYLYDYASSSFFYTSPTLFPYVYDFSLSAWLYYYPDANNPGHYTTNPRYFYNFSTEQIITL